MLNYVAMSLTSWLVKGPLRDPTLVSPQTPLIPIADRLPRWGTTRVHLGLIVALTIVTGLALLFRRARLGLELRVVGENPRTARHVMVPVRRLIVLVMLISGALAGLAGANDILSTKGTFQAEWNPQYGMAAFALVFLAQRKPLGLIPAALVLGFLAYGADILPRAANVAPDFFGLLEGLILASLAVVGVAQGRWLRRQEAAAPHAAQPSAPSVQETVI
jgi:general nucleoside transport system permease protein